MPEPIRLSLESSSGGEFSFSASSGTPTVIVYESLQNQSMNSWFRESAKKWAIENPAEAERIRLMVIVDASGVPSVVQDMVRSTVKSMIAPTGIKEVFFDWDRRFRVAMGLGPATSEPIYTVLDAENRVSWGRFGKLETKHWDELLQRLRVELSK